VNFDVTGPLLIILSAFIRYMRKSGSAVGQYQLCIDFKKAYDSVKMDFCIKSLLNLVTR
jgi:hypothetical protein